MQTENEIFGWKLVSFEPEGFANDTFDGIACDGFGGKTFGDDHAKARAFGVCRDIARGADHKQSPSGNALALQGRRIFGGAVQARRRCERGTHQYLAGARNVAGNAALDSQTLATFSAASVDNSAAATSFHANEKAVCALAACNGRLESAFHGAMPLVVPAGRVVSGFLLFERMFSMRFSNTRSAYLHRLS